VAAAWWPSWAFRLLRDDPGLVTRLHADARALRGELRENGFAVEPGTMPIVPLIVREPDAAMALSEHALANGIFAQAIRPPTVPDGTSRLRLVATAGHEEADLRAAAGTLAAGHPARLLTGTTLS
jgi:7-keto-8-aminopelargonate synthetase-like enzyme